MKIFKLGELFLIWIVLLIIELFVMYANMNSIEQALFFLALVLVTLVVGALVIYLKSKEEKDKKTS